MACVHITKICEGDREYLPNLVNTPLWDKISPEKTLNPKPSDRQIAFLYQAISERDNYFQDNQPTAFGNPEYSFKCGVVEGILRAMYAEEWDESDRCVIVKCDSHKKLLVIDKLRRPESYWAAVRDNREVWDAVFG